jgi:hypothetical protein
VIVMAKKIVATDSGQKRIRDIGPGARRVDPAIVAEALGAEETGITPGREGSPVSSSNVRSDQESLKRKVASSTVEADIVAPGRRSRARDTAR